MPALEKMTMILEPGKYYHLFSRGNNRGKIFFKKENYDYFIHSKILPYMSDYMDVLAWSLIPNHFHLTVHIKPHEDIFLAAERDFEKIPYQVMVNLPELSNNNLQNLANLSLSGGTNSDTNFPSELQTKLSARLVSERLRRCLLGYAKAINKQENRTGSLFQKIIRRDNLPEIDDLRRNIAYVHRNSIHHKMCKDYHLWPHSSFNQYLKNSTNNANGPITRGIEVFGGQDAFFDYHDKYLHRWKVQQISEWE